MCSNEEITYRNKEEIMKKRAIAMYHNPEYPERMCDCCHKPYTGPAIYCSFECAQADA